jgi:hypothetical protein
MGEPTATRASPPSAPGSRTPRRTRAPMPAEVLGPRRAPCRASTFPPEAPAQRHAASKARCCAASSCVPRDPRVKDRLYAVPSFDVRKRYRHTEARPRSGTPGQVSPGRHHTCSAATAADPTWPDADSEERARPSTGSHSGRASGATSRGVLGPHPGTSLPGGARPLQGSTLRASPAHPWGGRRRGALHGPNTAGRPRRTSIPGHESAQTRRAPGDGRRR